MDGASTHIVALMSGQIIAVLGNIAVNGVNRLDLKSIGHLNGHVSGGRIVEPVVDAEALVFRASQNTLPTGGVPVAAGRFAIPDDGCNCLVEGDTIVHGLPLGVTQVGHFAGDAHSTQHGSRHGISNSL